MNKIILYTENNEALARLIEMMRENDVKYFIVKNKNINKIIMFNPINNAKENQRIQRVMKKGMNALEKLTELGRV